MLAFWVFGAILFLGGVVCVLFADRFGTRNDSYAQRHGEEELPGARHGIRVGGVVLTSVGGVLLLIAIVTSLG